MSTYNSCQKLVASMECIDSVIRVAMKRADSQRTFIKTTCAVGVASVPIEATEPRRSACLSAQKSKMALNLPREGHAESVAPVVLTSRGSQHRNSSNNVSEECSRSRVQLCWWVCTLSDPKTG